MTAEAVWWSDKDPRQPERRLSVNVAEILGKHVTLELECIDRVFCNLYIPPLQYEGGVAHFFRERGFPFPSAALMAPISKAFVGGLERFAAETEFPETLVL